MAKHINPAADPAHKETDKLISNLTKKLRHTYSKAYGDAAEKFSVYMAAFERKDTAHKADVAAGRWTEQEYTNWRRNQLLYADTLAGIRDTLAQDLHNVNKIAIKMVRDEQFDVYALNHNYGTYEVEHGLGIDTSFTLYDHDTVERLMREDPDLLPRPSARRQAEIDAKDIAWNKQKLASTFTASILAGDSIPKMAERIATVAAMDQNAAIRNARTMCTGAENAGRNDSYKRAKGMGINMKQQWMSTLDERTRDSHVQLDGEIIEVGQKYSNGLRYPGDPDGPAAEVYNCRCTQVAVVNGIDPGAFDKTATLQRKLDNKDITYEKWKEEHRKKKSISKNITIGDFDDLKAGIKQTGHEYVKDEIVDFVRDTLVKRNSLGVFDGLSVRKLDKNIVMNTDVTDVGTWGHAELQLNRVFFEGKSKADVDRRFRKSNKTVCNSLEDAVIHEEYHARMTMYANYAQLEALSEPETDEDKIKEISADISPTASQDVLELISEIGVLKERGEYGKVKKKYRKIFETYFPKER